MSISELDGPPSWSLDASETGESTKCPRIGVVEGTADGKTRETVMHQSIPAVPIPPSPPG